MCAEHPIFASFWADRALPCVVLRRTITHNIQIRLHLNRLNSRFHLQQIFKVIFLVLLCPFKADLMALRRGWSSLIRKFQWWTPRRNNCFPTRGDRWYNTAHWLGALALGWRAFTHLLLFFGLLIFLKLGLDWGVSCLQITVFLSEAVLLLLQRFDVLFLGA